MQEKNQKYLRLNAIYSPSQMTKLQKAKVAVIGLGGVGSFCATALARSAIGHLVLVDFDKIEHSNINRQEFAFCSTVGKKKIDVANKVIKDINPEICLSLYEQKIDVNNTEKICENCDYIVDAIDDVPAKIALVKYAQENNIPIVSCMGTAMRTQPELLHFDCIENTSVCPLCKSFRKLARSEGIKNLKVLYSKEKVIKSSDECLGSTSFVPPSAGMMLAGHVINFLTGKNIDK